MKKLTAQKARQFTYIVTNIKTRPQNKMLSNRSIYTEGAKTNRQKATKGIFSLKEKAL